MYCKENGEALLLEQEDLIYPADRYVWEEACCFLRQRIDRGLLPVHISVNVSRSDLYKSDFRAFLHYLTEKYELRPEMLHLEILERAYMKDSPYLTEILKTLRMDGFRIEIDDFGIGDSSLTALTEMPADCLKLDRSFLLHNFPSVKQQEIICLIVNFAKTCGYKVIAEGIETAEHAEFLRSIGCDYGQGYFYYRPMPAVNLLEKPFGAI